MATIVWTSKSKNSYSDILQYTMDHATDAAIKLDDKVERQLDKLTRFTHLCASSQQFPELRRCVITKHISMYYEIKGNYIILHGFSDNRKRNPF